MTIWVLDNGCMKEAVWGGAPPYRTISLEEHWVEESNPPAKKQTPSSLRSLADLQRLGFGSLSRCEVPTTLTSGWSFNNTTNT